MKKFYFVLAMVAVAVTSCQKEYVSNDAPKQNQSVELPNSNTRSYDEALAIAEDALKLLESDETRSTTKRVIKRNEGQTVLRPVTRGGEENEEPIMYVFNNEDNMGFTVVAADRSQQPLIAVTEYGNYTFGEPTGVEPFDLLMEDVATTLSVLPDQPMAIKVEKSEYAKKFKYGPTTTVQWGVNDIYGSLYPDGVAYDEAAAIAQAFLAVPMDTTYTVTNPNDALYGQTITINLQSLNIHQRDDTHGSVVTHCTDAIHNQIARLYLEIGYRLSNGSSVGLSNKTIPFTLSKVSSVLTSFGADVDSTIFDNKYPWPHFSNPIIMILPTYSVFVFRGEYGGLLSNSAHTWLSTGCYLYCYYEVESTLNYLLDPNHPDPYGYTETNRELKYDSMYHMNWGFDGYSDGWFAAGCFNTRNRETMEDENFTMPQRPTVNYNYTNVQLIEIHNPFYNANL